MAARDIEPENARSPATRRGTATRDRIVGATVACLVRFGFAATTVETVMAESGVSRGSVLHQFPTRIDLLIAVAEHAMARVIDHARELADVIPDPVERLAGYAEIVWKSHASAEGLALTEILQASRWNGELADGIRPLARRIEVQVRDELVMLATDAGVSAPERLVARGWMLIASTRGLLIELGVEANRPMIEAAVGEMLESHRRYCARITSGEDD